MPYSQNREEQLIWDAVKKWPADLRKTVVDIGAHDGITNSNSLALIEKGWYAVLIEPSPTCFLKLLERHADNPRVTLINAAVGTEKTVVKFYECADDQCGTTVKANRDLWAGAGRKFREYWVPQVTIEELVQQVGFSADVLSVDTEGTAFDIVGKCPIQSWTTKAIVIEHDKRAYEIAAWAEERKYNVYGLNAENITLIRRDE